jgi:hypothetical protein
MSASQVDWPSEGDSMSRQGVQVGQPVPDFELNVYDAAKDEFDRFSLAENK